VSVRGIKCMCACTSHIIMCANDYSQSKLAGTLTFTEILFSIIAQFLPVSRPCFLFLSLSFTHTNAQAHAEDTQTHSQDGERIGALTYPTLASDATKIWLGSVDCNLGYPVPPPPPSTHTHTHIQCISIRRVRITMCFYACWHWISCVYAIHFTPLSCP